MRKRASESPRARRRRARTAARRLRGFGSGGRRRGRLPAAAARRRTSRDARRHRGTTGAARDPASAPSLSRTSAPVAGVPSIAIVPPESSIDRTPFIARLRPKREAVPQRQHVEAAFDLTLSARRSTPRPFAPPRGRHRRWPPPRRPEARVASRFRIVIITWTPLRTRASAAARRRPRRRRARARRAPTSPGD